MSCCTSPTPARGKQCCPQDHQQYIAVNSAAMLHHLKSPWQHSKISQRWFFCDSADCDVVYFAEDASVIRENEVHGRIGQKQTDKGKILCYCFHITLADVEKDPSIKAFVIQQTKTGACSCETSNPSGRCCLKNFPAKSG